MPPLKNFKYCSRYPHCKNKIKLTSNFKKCVSCRRVNNKYYHKNKDNYRDRNLRNKYGITLEYYNFLYKKQKGLCAICCSQKPDRGREGLTVDHNHITGRVRELLCTPCNTTLGNIKDDIIILEKAIEYLQKHKGSSGT